MWLIKKIAFILIPGVFFKVVVYPYIESYMHTLICIANRRAYLLVNAISFSHMPTNTPKISFFSQ